jgi:hypothetical protein
MEFKQINGPVQSYLESWRPFPELKRGLSPVSSDSNPDVGRMDRWAGTSAVTHLLWAASTSVMPPDARPVSFFPFTSCPHGAKPESAAALGHRLNLAAAIQKTHAV